MYEYKIALIGCEGVGKTSIIRKLITNNFSTNYIPTLGIEVFNLRFKTTVGIIQFNIWDCAGQDKYGGLRDGYYIKSDACIGVMDNIKLSSTKLTQLINNFTNICPNVPIITVLNKCELVLDKCKEDTTYISAKESKNLKQPFLQLARQLTGILDLEFIEM